jgi:hypothetical protein
MGENARDLGAINACVAGTENALVLRLRLVCLSNTPVFRLSQIEIWIGTQEFTFQIGQFWIVKPFPIKIHSFFRSLERGRYGFAIQSKKNGLDM